MGNNIFYTGLTAHVNELLKTDPRTGAIVGECLSLLVRGEYHQCYVDVMFQKDFRQGGINIYDAYGFSSIHAQMRLGKIAAFQIPVCDLAAYDKNTDGNNARLKSMPAPFCGEFFGGTQDEDGYIKWSEPVNALIQDGTEALFCIARPSRVPLEVGTTDVAKTMFYIDGGGGVARYPYGQKYITVLLPSWSILRTCDAEFEELRKAVYGGDYFVYQNPYDIWVK